MISLIGVKKYGGFGAAGDKLRGRAAVIDETVPALVGERIAAVGKAVVAEVPDWRDLHFVAASCTALTLDQSKRP